MNKEIICPNCSQRIKILDTIGYDLYLENLKKEEREIERLKEEYMILQNASDEVEEEKDKEIERLNSIIKEVRELCLMFASGRLERTNYDDILEILDKVGDEK